MFEKLVWRDDRVVLEDLVFRIEYAKNEQWELGEDCLVLFKPKHLYDEYARFFSMRPNQAFSNVLELGIWDGGSVAIWYECLRPDKHVAVDLSQRGDKPYFQRYLASRGLTGRIKTFWGVNQADPARLRAIVAAEFRGPLDLVLDDCSHLYHATKSSFETLFPLLRSGGLYIIEDWAWSHVPQHQGPESPFAKQVELTRLVFDLVEATGSSSLVANLYISQGFAAVERGRGPIPTPNSFSLDAQISRRPVYGLKGRLAGALKRLAGP